jgi:hypothetical protein
VSKIKKSKSTKSLRKKLWKLVSEYVRRKDVDARGNAICYTCGFTGAWNTLDCGHYIHRDCLDFEVNNLRPQCTRCNRYLHGNLGVYSEKLIKEIGEEEISLMRQRSKQVKKWEVGELEGQIETYKQTLKDLDSKNS